MANTLINCCNSLLQCIFALALATQLAGAACPLDGASFELVTNVRHMLGRKNVDIRLEERYSGRQSRGQVRLRAYGLAELRALTGDAAPKLDFEAGTLFYDAQENMALQYDDGSGACKQVEPDTLLRLAGLFFKPGAADQQPAAQRHLFGSARWLQYFCERRSELKADVSGLPFSVRNVPSVRYTTSFQNEQGTQTDVSVYYRESELASETRHSALPDRIMFKSSQEGVSTMLDIAPIRYVANEEDEYLPVEPAAGAESGLDTEVQVDPLLLAPVTCHALMFAKLEHQPIFGQERVRRVSFSALIARDNDHQYSTQVAYDGHLDMMRVDLATPRLPVRCSRQVFNFHRNTAYHLLEGANLRRHLLLDHLIAGGGVAGNEPLASSPTFGERPDDLLQNLNGQADGAATSSSCANAQIDPPQIDNGRTGGAVKRSLGELLLGSDSFLYLGRARVRGRQALVYAAVGSQLPYWLGAPVDAERQLAEKLERHPGQQQYVTHLYVSEVPAERPDEDSQVLLMEIYSTDPACKLVYDKLTVALHDFSWSLRALRTSGECSRDEVAESADGDSAGPAALFSLAQHCAASSTGGQDESARFELLLESARATPTAVPTARAWLAANRADLELQVLAGLQRGLNFMVDMISRLEAKLLPGSDTPVAQPIRVATSFEMTRHSNVTTRLSYQGFGYRPKGRSLGLAVTSLHECFMLAAHRRQPVDLAYDPLGQFCYIGLGEAGAGDLEQSKIGNLHVYRTRKEFVRQRGVLDSLRTAQHTETKHVQLRDRRLALVPNSPVSFLVKRLEIRNQRQPSPLGAAADTNNSTTPHTAAARLLAGFGLREQAGVSERAWLPPGEEQTSASEDQPLTLDQCRALCLASLECRAVSYCVHGAHAECVLSRLDLGAPAVLEQLRAATRAAEPHEKTFHIALKDGGKSAAERITIELTRQPNCEIHNKQYLEYFERDHEARPNNLQFVELARAASVEDCARTCLGATLAALRAHHTLLASSLERLEGALGERATGADDQADALQAVQELDARAGRLTDCKSFHFINALKLYELESSDTLEELDRYAKAIGSNISLASTRDADEEELATPEAGFCVFRRWPRKSSEAEMASAPQLRLRRDVGLEFQKWDLQAGSALYEEQHGVRLRASQLTSDEAAAYEEVRQASETQGQPSAQAIEIVHRLLRRGENFQVLTVGSRQVCANQCLRHQAIWPACRSFDLYVELAPGGGGGASLKCALNSMTRSQLVERHRADLIDSTTATSSWNALQPRNPKLARTVQDFWHYEPREGLLAAEWVAAEESAMAGLMRQLGAGSSLEFFRRELLLLLMATGIALGAFAGVHLVQYAKRLGYLNEPQHARPRTGSVSSTRALDLANETFDLPPIREEQADGL